MEYFKLIRIDRNNLLVIVLTFEMSDMFWRSLNDSLSNMGIDEGDLYMDYSYRNGDSNFSFCASIANHTIQQHNIKRCVFPKAIDREVMKFYINNKIYVERSNMSHHKKLHFLMR